MTVIRSGLKDREVKEGYNFRLSWQVGLLVVADVELLWLVYLLGGFRWLQ